LGEHNAGLSHYTSTKGPWRLVHIEVLESKEKALKRERSLKKYSHKQIAELAASNKNILTHKAETSPQQVVD
jgi:putative endonuclease